MLVAVGVVAVSLAIWLAIPPWQSIDISGFDVAKNHIYAISMDDENDFAHGLSIRIRGSIDGTAQITTHHDSLNVGIIAKFGPGDVCVDYGGDYYDSEAEIIYTPITAKSGELKVYYNFEH